MKLDGTNISCGVFQYSGLSNNPKTIVKYIVDTLKKGTITKDMGYGKAHRKPPAIIFSDEVGEHGDDLANYIEENELGKVIKSPTFNNPSPCKNDIAIWIWLLDYKALGLQKLWDDRPYHDKVL